MIATSCGHIELIDALIQTGADVNKCNQYDNSVLDIAEGVEKQDVIQLLKMYGATNVNPVDEAVLLSVQPLYKSYATKDLNKPLHQSVTVNTAQKIQPTRYLITKQIPKMVKKLFHMSKQKPAIETTNRELYAPIYYSSCTVASY